MNWHHGRKRKALALGLALVFCSAAALSACESVGHNTVTSPSFTAYDGAADPGEPGLLMTIDTAGLTSVGVVESGVYYRTDSGNYGVMTFDGAYDTGAVFAEVVTADGYFIETKETSALTPTPESMNRYGLVDAKGRQLIPEEYASIRVLSDQYASAIRVLNETDDEYEAILYYADNMISFAYQAGSMIFAGEWEIFDLSSGKRVRGASGTNMTTTQYAARDLLVFTDDDGERVRMNAKGRELPALARPLTNGCYVMPGEEDAGVFRMDGTEIFRFDPSMYLMYSFEETDIYYAGLRTGYGIKYVILDENGEEASAYFDAEPQAIIDGVCVFADGELLDYKGNPIVPGEFDEIWVDTDLNRGVILREGNTYSFVRIWLEEGEPEPEEEDYGYGYYDYDYDEDYDDEEDEAAEEEAAPEETEPVMVPKGEVILTVDATAEIAVEPEDFYVTQDSSKGPLLYRFDTGEYSILDFSVRANWLARVAGAGDGNDLLDYLTGETVLEGYRYYTSTLKAPHTLILLAEAEDHADIYQIVT